MTENTEQTNSRKIGTLLGPRVDSDQRTVIVLGAARGGTSSIAGVLIHLGIHMGDHFQGNNHEDVAFHSRDIDSLRSTIKDRNEKHRIWGWKVPGSIAHLNDIVDSVINPHFIVVYRSPLDVAHSISSKNANFTLPEALRNASRRYIHIANFLNQHQDLRFMLVNFDDLIANQQQFVNEIIDYLDITPDQADVTNAVHFINKGKGYQHIS